MEATTDDRFPPHDMTDPEAMAMMRDIYRRIVPVAEQYEITINIEPHDYFTKRPEFMAEMLSFVDSPYFGLNMDTGNTFIAGADPAAFLAPLLHKVTHVHIKGVSPSLAAAPGELTGIAVSHCRSATASTRQILSAAWKWLAGAGYGGVVSIECEVQGGPMIERSLEWRRPGPGRGCGHAEGSARMRRTALLPLVASLLYAQPSARPSAPSSSPAKATPSTTIGGSPGRSCETCWWPPASSK